MDFLKTIGLTVAVFLLIGLSACEAERPTESAFPGLDTSVTADASVTDLAAGKNTATDLSGTWYVFAQSSTCVDALGNMVETLSWSWYVLELERTPLEGQDPDVIRYSAHMRQCTVDLSPVVLNLKGHVSDAIVDNAPSMDFELVEMLGDDHRFYTSATVELWGVDLAHPLTDPLPTEPNDPAVVDTDKDNQPGVTLVLGDDFCDMYMVQVSRNMYDGEISSLSMAKGDHVAELSKVILGGTDALCTAQNESLSNPGYNRFWMLRADGTGELERMDGDGDGSITCKDVKLDQVQQMAEAILEIERSDTDSSHCDNLR